MSSFRMFASAVLLTVTGCGAHAPLPLRVRYAELATAPEAHQGQSVIVEFSPGDRIPVELRFDDQAFALGPEKPGLELVAQRRCFIMIGSERLRTSLNGTDFAEKPKALGRFNVQLELDRRRRGLRVEVVTPRH